MIKVSIIIPTYNRNNDLKECEDSLMKQESPFSDFEAIIIDDGSTDNTKSLFIDSTRWKNMQLTYLQQEKKGPTSAMNKGIRMAKGAILSFIDSDCIAEKSWIRNIILYHEMFPKVMAIQGNYLDITNNHFTAIVEQKLQKQYLDYLISNKKEDNLIGLLISCNCSIKKEAFSLLNCFFDESLRSGYDIDIANQLLAKKEKIIYIKEITVKHKNRASLSSYLQRYFIVGRGEYLLQIKWEKSYRDYELNKLNKPRFALELFREFISEYKLAGVFYFIICLLRKLSRKSGFIYEKIKKLT